MPMRAAIQQERLFFDGGMGSMLQAAGLPDGLLPDVWNIQNPAAVQAIHAAYLRAGSTVISTNTFGAAEDKLAPYGYCVAQVVDAAVQNVRAAMQETGKTAYIAVDLGPTGKLLRPYGDLDFEDAVRRFVPLVQAAQGSGADCLLIETMSDLYEMKAAVLAAKEHSDLPIFASLIFDAQGKLLTGGDAKSTVALLEGLGVCAIGLNCGLGPAQLAPVLHDLYAAASIPLFVQPNAGLPETQEGKTVYRVSPSDFAAEMQALAPYARGLGGCCGTTPAHIEAMIAACRAILAPTITQKETLLISSYCRAVSFGDTPIVIGERINPTGKKKLQAALREQDSSYVLREALAQEEAGAVVLDVNVGLPDLDEVQLLSDTAESIQSVTALPLQLDSSNPAAMERALRRYNGKPLINSVNGKQESLDAILPLVQKYGGGLVCLCLDETGIPDTVEGRLAIAEHIAQEAARYGIPRRELLIDALTLPVSAGEENARITLETLRRAKHELGLHTALGVSNVSFGLPRREQLNTAFFTLAMQAGLDGAIINPNSADMMGAYRSFRALWGQDGKSADYIEAYRDSSATPATASTSGGVMTLFDAVCKGLAEEALRQARQELDSQRPVLEIINDTLVPALDAVGRSFEAGTLFLPQLLMSAEAAKSAFSLLKEHIPAEEGESASLVVLATVKGDIHDIGKNIVKVLLESYRFPVLDLGKDVPPERIVEAVRDSGARLLGLSALMTTTAPYMEETIRALRAAGLPCAVVVGGAVITQDYADRIGADHYAADAMETVHIAQALFAE